MKIAISHPFCWPYVRRGAERFIAELARHLTRRGHSIVTVSMKPGRAIVEQTDYGQRILHRHAYWPPLRRLRIQPTHGFLFSSMKSFATLDVDVVHAAYYLDAFAANFLRCRRRYKTVFQITGPPVPHYFPRLPPDRWVLRKAVAGADRLFVHSAFTRNIVRQYYGADPRVIPVPVDMAAFEVREGPRPSRPTIFSAASFDERRKGLRVLVKAFEQVKRDRPDAVLRLSGHLSEATRQEVIDPLPQSVRDGIDILGLGKVEEMYTLYQQASVTVLPSMWDAYGMVLVESWACGTPVVATNHGGMAELVTDDDTGLLFEPKTEGQETMNVEGLARAIHGALALADRPETTARCRARANSLSWEAVGPAYEALYDFE